MAMKKYLLIGISLCLWSAAGVASAAEQQMQDAAQQDTLHALAQTNSRVREFDVSPDGTRIAYMSRGDDDMYSLWVMSAAGGDAKNILAYPFEETHLSWSPDGKWLLYSAAGDVFKISADGGTPPL